MRIKRTRVISIRRAYTEGNVLEIGNKKKKTEKYVIKKNTSQITN